MKYHIQEHLYNKEDSKPRGSCYPTALACILDIELHDVPYFHLLYFKTKDETDNITRYFEKRFLNGKSLEEYVAENGEDSSVENYNHFRPFQHWVWDNVREYWLASLGYKESYIGSDNIDEWVATNKDVPYMVTGKSPRDVLHVVIYMNGKMIHDPHPSQAGVFETEDTKFSYSYLEKI